MLTLTETLDVIRAIDTDNEIIRTACRKFLNPDQNPSPSIEEMAIRISEFCTNLSNDISDVLNAMSMSLAVQAAVSVHKGRELRALKTILSHITKHYYVSLINILELQGSKDPEAATKRLVTLMTDFAKFDEGKD